MRELVFATNNANKLREAREIAGDRIRILSLADINCHEELPETSDTLEGNAIQKATYVKEHYGYDCFADDTGLMVEALGNAPGVYTARYAGPDCNPQDNIDKLLRELSGKENRTARFCTVVAYIHGDCDVETFRGEVVGSIALQREGTSGFGYDPVFIPEESGVSFAMMSAEEKNRISHRGRAMRRFAERLLMAPLSEDIQ